MAKRPNPSNAKIRDLRAQVRDLNAALTDCMQHKVDLEIALDDMHRRNDGANEKVQNLKDRLERAEEHIERQAIEISTLKRTVRTVAAFAAREPGVDVRPSRYGRSPGDIDTNLLHAQLAGAGLARGVKSALHAGDGYGATETL